MTRNGNAVIAGSKEDVIASSKEDVIADLIRNP
jgi:hypothetical protein